MKTTHILIGLMATGSIMIAGSVTIPNTFVAGHTAKASEVNANFSAVKSAVDGNANDIATNVHDIGTKQNRVSGSCAAGSSIREIAADGTVTCETDSDSGAQMWVRDHEGNIHPTVKIGDQTWMADNMYVTTYPDGTAIDDPSTWTDGSDNAYAYPIHQASNYVGNASTPIAVKGDIDIKRYGLFYQYYAAVKNDTDGDAQGICPNGWHIPTNADWDALQAALGDNTPTSGLWSNGAAEKIGDQMKVGGKSGFSALFSGYHTNAVSTYRDRGNSTWFYAATSTPSGYRGLARAQSGFLRTESGVDPTFGFNVRCIKD